MTPLKFNTIKVPGHAAIDTLELLRQNYPQTGEYPFLIGDAEELERVRGAAEYNDQDFDDLIRESLSLDLSAWMRTRREEVEEYGFSDDDVLGEWPEEDVQKGSISLHLDVLSRKVKLDVYLGLAKISQPWQLPAILKYGGWNECPGAEVHCAIHRKWQSEYGAEIVGMSGDVVECVVKNPPRDKAAAMELAWQQYWYCADIVEQGCESISNLAATLVNSGYWYFWWD